MAGWAKVDRWEGEVLTDKLLMLRFADLDLSRFFQQGSTKLYGAQQSFVGFGKVLRGLKNEFEDFSNVYFVQDPLQHF